jgi:transglutaminase-like putative cysteine protease
MANDCDPYLRPGFFADSGHPAVVAFAREAAGGASDPAEVARRLFYAVRDGIRYDPYSIEFTRRGFQASRCLERRVGFCVPKATLLAACARALGIPARLGFADVRNHLASPRLLALMETDTFVFHGYAELLLGERWVKATPAFNRGLCDRFRVPCLEFDGRNDALFQPFDPGGRRFMEYLRDRGVHADVPFDEIVKAFREAHPKLFARLAGAGGEDGMFAGGGGAVRPDGEPGDRGGRSVDEAPRPPRS